MLLKRINNWFTHFQQYFFVYKKGFYELSYLGNSPEAMVKSLMKMPFVTHNEKEQTLITNSPFAEGIMHYQELEEGLWIIFSEMIYKANVSFKPVFDKFIPCDYYQVGYSYNKNEVTAYGLKVNEAVFPHKSWAINKRTHSKNAAAYYYFKNTVSTDIGVYFSKSWAEKHLENNRQFIQSKFNDFFEGSSNYIIWPETSSAYEKKREELKTTMPLMSRLFFWVKYFFTPVFLPDLVFNQSLFLRLQIMKPIIKILCLQWFNIAAACCRWRLFYNCC
jgi:hypothetical protein